MSDRIDVLKAYERTTIYAVCALHDDEDGACWTPETLRIAPDGRLVCQDCWGDYGDKAGGTIVERDGYEYVAPDWRDLPQVPSLFDEVRRLRADLSTSHRGDITSEHGNAEGVER